ncbi:hypothetical protein GBA52_001667 [Prunus armeniaca]|nr:hypothetical protein GBA52_001667 [Prunus armeniaca]
MEGWSTSHLGCLLKQLKVQSGFFVLSTSRALYVGQKRKGSFQHSSFLSGGATTAAGRLVAHNGVLEAIWPYSGHYLPTEDNFKEFISFLEEHHVDLTNVKMCATDDDKASYKAPYDDLSKTELNGPITNDPNPITQQHESIGVNAEAPAFDLSRPLSCKWTSGLGHVLAV